MQLSANQYVQPVLPPATLSKDVAQVVRNTQERCFFLLDSDSSNGRRRRARTMSPVRGSCNVAKLDLPLPGSDESEKQLGELAASVRLQPGRLADPAHEVCISRSPARNGGMVSNSGHVLSPCTATPPASFARTPESLCARTASPIRGRDPTGLTPDPPTLSPRPQQALVAGVHDCQYHSDISQGGLSSAQRVITNDRDLPAHGSFKLVGKPALSLDSPPSIVPATLTGRAQAS